MRKLAAMAGVLAMVTSASAATFTATLVAPQGTQVIQGASLDIEVHGVLDTAVDNDGLVFVSVDITATGPADLDTGTAVAWGPPADGSMDNFVQPAGYDANYGGTPVGISLLQSGGAQNTIGNNPALPPNLLFPDAEFIDFGVAQTNQVIFEGTITIPNDQALGPYTLSLENVLANVLADGQTPVSFGVYSVEAADGVGSSIDIEVVEGCAPAGFIAGAQGVSFSDRAFDGFIDARRESADGATIIGLDSFTFQFTTGLENNDGTPLSASAFSIVDTAGLAPNITGIDTVDGMTVTVNLSDHITLQEWTTISVSARSQCAPADTFNGSIDIGYLPADVNQSGNVNPLDLLKFKQYVNNISTPPAGVIEDYIDTNRSGGINPLDLLAFKQLINGITPPATQVWANAGLPAQP